MREPLSGPLFAAVAPSLSPNRKETQSAESRGRGVKGGEGFCKAWHPVGVRRVFERGGKQGQPRKPVKVSNFAV